MKDDTLERNNTGLPSETHSPYYKELPTFSASTVQAQNVLMLSN